MRQVLHGYDLSPYSGHGWLWTMADGRRFRTDGEGKGLWVWNADSGDWVTCPPGDAFSLPADREAALEALRRAGMLPRKVPEGEEDEGS